MTSARPLRATVIALDNRTREDAWSCLVAAGASVETCRFFGELADVRAGALVVFPDDYPDDEILRALKALRARRPRVRMVLVTSRPRYFEELLVSRRGGVAPQILPRPVFAWALVDAVRGDVTSRPL